ncbi:SDR family oxidoreductase [Arenimonas sp.]|uniref:SDR family oxidoreductase n=1 Tax=Arenimonas sp. TaxID=1872635 RepID=UPI0039E53CBD
MKSPVVVLDAARGAGRGVVEAALDEGRAVIAVSLDPTELRGLHKRYPGADLNIVAGSIADEASAAALASALRELERPIAGVVICTCSEPVPGRVLDHSTDELKRRFEGDLFPQLAAARHLIPLLAESGRNGGYVVIGSPGSENPWAGYGHRSIAASAISMLVRVLHEEARQIGVRVQLLGVLRPVRTAENDALACEGWPSATAIGEQALSLIDQSDARRAAMAVVPFNPDAPRRPKSAARFEPQEPALLAQMVAPKPQAKAQFADSGPPIEGQRYLDQAWSLLEPLFSHQRNEAKQK